MAPTLSVTMVALRDSYFSIDPRHSRTMDTDMVFGSNWVWMSPLSQVAVQATQIGRGPLDTIMALISGVCLPSMVTGASDISTDPGCCRATDPDMALS